MFRDFETLLNNRNFPAFERRSVLFVRFKFKMYTLLLEVFFKQRHTCNYFNICKLKRG